MAKLKLMWIERDLTKVNEETNEVIRIDWDNDRHQRVEILGDTPEQLSMALREAADLIDAEIAGGEI